jgi:hypothetical protein
MDPLLPDIPTALPVQGFELIDRLIGAAAASPVATATSVGVPALIYLVIVSLLKYLKGK